MRRIYCILLLRRGTGVQPVSCSDKTVPLSTIIPTRQREPPAEAELRVPQLIHTWGIASTATDRRKEGRSFFELHGLILLVLSRPFGTRRPYGEVQDAAQAQQHKIVPSARLQIFTVAMGAALSACVAGCFGWSCAGVCLRVCLCVCVRVFVS
jgi:hypothetical protein